MFALPLMHFRDGKLGSTFSTFSLMLDTLCSHRIVFWPCSLELVLNRILDLFFLLIVADTAHTPYSSTAFSFIMEQLQ